MSLVQIYDNGEQMRTIDSLTEMKNNSSKRGIIMVPERMIASTFK